MATQADERLEESKIMLTQPSLAGTGTELGKNNVFFQATLIQKQWWYRPY
jgi:hypothetical protein